MAKSKCRWECPEQWSEWSEWLAAGLHAQTAGGCPSCSWGSCSPEAAVRSPPGCEPQASASTFRITITSSPVWDASANRSPPSWPCSCCRRCPCRSVCCWSSTIHRPGDTGRRSREPTCITTRHRGRPINLTCTDTSGSRSRWRCGIRGGVRWRCRCGPCSTSVRRPCRRFLAGAAGEVSPPSWNWPRSWSSGSFRSLRLPRKRCGSSSTAATPSDRFCGAP